MRFSKEKGGGGKRKKVTLKWHTRTHELLFGCSDWLYSSMYVIYSRCNVLVLFHSLSLSSMCSFFINMIFLFSSILSRACAFQLFNGPMNDYDLLTLKDKQYHSSYVLRTHTQTLLLKGKWPVVTHGSDQKKKFDTDICI